MNARELLAHFDFSFIKSDEDRTTILRALALLAAVDDSDGLVRELRDAGVFVTDDGKRYPAIRDTAIDEAAARIVALQYQVTLYEAEQIALKAELASVKAHAEAMAGELDHLLSFLDNYQGMEWNDAKAILAAYRAAHPKEGT